MKKKLLPFIVTFLFLLLLTVMFLMTLKMSNGETCPDEGLARLDLATDRHPDDHFYEDLMALAAGVQYPEEENGVNVKRLTWWADMSREELEELLDLNSEVLQSLGEKLNEGGPFGAAHTPEIGNQLRIPSPIIRPVEEPSPMLSELRTLKRLLLGHARLMSLKGDQEALNQDLGDIAVLTGFELQNPTLIQLMVSVSTGVEWFDMLANELPADQLREEHLALIPDGKRIRQGLVQSFYLEDVLSEDVMTRQILEMERWAFLITNPCKTRKKVFANFKHKEEGLGGALLQYKGPPPILNGGRPNLKQMLFDNGMIWILMDVATPMYEKFVLKVGGYEAAAHAARVRILLETANQPQNQETVKGLVQQHGLINPFTNQPYGVDPDGRLILFPEGTPSLDAVEFLEPFGTWLALPF